jgi:hypothetical protein
MESAGVAVGDQAPTIIALSLQPPRHRTAGSVSGPVDGDVQIGFGIIDHDARGAAKGDLNSATLILAPARAVLVGQANRDLAQVLIGPTERELQAPFDVFAQTVGQRETSDLDVDVHRISPLGIEGDEQSRGWKNIQQSE